MVPSAMGHPLQSHGHPSYNMMGPSYENMAPQIYYPEQVRHNMQRTISHPRPGQGMRVVKPSSANSSPNSAMGRRRTYMNDAHGADRRRQQVLDQALYEQLQARTMVYGGGAQPPVRRQGRPMSWHPQQQQPQAYQQATQPGFTLNINSVPASQPQADMYTGYFNHFAAGSTPAYSAQASPTAHYSPYAPSAQASVAPYSLDPCSGDMAHSNNGSPGGPEPFPAFTTQPMWEAYASFPSQMAGSHSPPTPNDNQCAPQQEPEVSGQEYQPMDGAEEEGEILVGMGLYDAPDKTDSDPGLDHYRTSTSQLLGSTYRRGQGLKLEEAWEPPVTEDEAEEDSDGEEQDE